MTPTRFRKPRTDRLLRVQFRCGYVSRHEYTSDQLRWTDSGSDYDIVAVEYSDAASAAGATWNPVSGGY